MKLNILELRNWDYLWKQPVITVFSAVDRIRSHTFRCWSCVLQLESLDSVTWMKIVYQRKVYTNVYTERERLYIFFLRLRTTLNDESYARDLVGLGCFREHICTRDKLMNIRFLRLHSLRSIYETDEWPPLATQMLRWQSVDNKFPIDVF